MFANILLYGTCTLKYFFLNVVMKQNVVFFSTGLIHDAAYLMGFVHADRVSFQSSSVRKHIDTRLTVTNTSVVCPVYPTEHYMFLTGNDGRTVADNGKIGYVLGKAGLQSVCRKCPTGEYE